MSDKHHRSLLLNFISSKEIVDMENDWLKLTKNSEEMPIVN